MCGVPSQKLIPAPDTEQSASSHGAQRKAARVREPLKAGPCFSGTRIHKFDTKQAAGDSVASRVPHLSARTSLVLLGHVRRLVRTAEHDTVRNAAHCGAMQ